MTITTSAITLAKATKAAEATGKTLEDLIIEHIAATVED